MTQHWADDLNFGRKLLLPAVVIAAMAGPIVFGLLHAPPTRAQSTAAPQEQATPAQSSTAAPTEFEVATIKRSDPDRPGKDIEFRGRRFITSNFTLNDLIVFAYHLKPSQVIGGFDHIERPSEN